MNIPAEHEAAVDQYLANLKLFLMEPDHGDNSWPTITPEQLHEANSLVAYMLSLKWGEDCDHAKPVTISMNYRRTHRLVWDIPLRVSPEDEATETESRRLLRNLRVITGALGSYTEELRHIERRLDELARLDVCAAASFPVWLARYSKSEVWMAGEHKYDQPASLHLSEEAARAFIPPEGFTKGKIVPRWAIPGTYDSPADNFADYRKRVAAACEALGPQFRWLEKLRLANHDPRQVEN